MTRGFTCFLYYFPIELILWSPCFYSPFTLILLKMVFDIILPIWQLFADPIKDYVVTPIERRVNYAFKCDGNVQRLQQQVEQLQSKKLRLQQSVDDAKRNGEEIFPDVSKWLTVADKDIAEAEELLQRKDDAKKNKCFFGFCPDFKTRYQLSKNAEKKALAIDKRCNEEGLDLISFQPPLQQIVEPSLYSREALPSRVLMLNQVMDALKDSNLHTIGVYGMGGVGKTTLAKEVQAKALQDKLFETAVVVPVSQTPELRRMQGEIADFLGLKFSAEEIPGRASQLFKRLENSKVLIILDDLWHKLDLNAVGIPSQGCKIMLTSRNGDLLSNEMQAQKLFSLEALKEEETLCLFQMSVAEANDPQFHEVANEIAKKCGGLPLLVDMVAKDLRNKESYEWNHKLHQLSAAGDGEIYEKVHRVLESSYDNLPGEEMKQFFLLCALFGQSNIQIQYLLTHSMGLGLFKRIFTVEAARDSVFTMINKLKAKSLLLDGDMAGYVKMHDVVRDIALSIASKVQHAFFGAGEVRFRNWRNRDCTRISLPYCNISELPVGLDCPEAEAFLLYTEDLSLKIPDRFFDGMQKLKVADLRGMRLLSFPSSFALLANLQTLCLHKCRLDSLAVIGELRQLEYLSLANSNVVELPREIEALTSLKLLDLQGCRDLRVIHVNLFSRLCLLEELYMLDSFVRWNARGNVRLVELESLAQLSTLEIQIPDPKMIPEGFKCFSQLRRYKISIGWSQDRKWEPERSRMLKLKVEAGLGLEYDPELLLRETEDLVLDGVRGIERIFYEGFSKLKCMCVENVSDIQHLIKSTMPASCRDFPVLESLSMKNLQMLETICSGQLGMGSFGELRVLKISRCDKLSSLFSFSSIKCLQKLQTLEVEYCGNMEAVVGEGSEVNDEGIELIQLISLRLSSLPHLTGFCNIKEGTEQMGVLFNSKMVSFPNLTSLEVLECKSLKHIFSVSMVKCLMQLKKLEISDCELVEEIIQRKKLEEIEEEEGDSREAIVFPKLDYLSLEKCKNVKRFSSCCSIEFPLLRVLRIKDCSAIANFVGRDSSSESSEEYLFNEMVTFSNLKTMRIDGMASIKYLWDEQHIADDSFSKLKSISISSCSKLAVVFPSQLFTRFQRVEMLSLSSCDGVEELYQSIDLEKVNEPFSLRELWIYDLQSLKQIWNKESEWNKGSFSTFQNLQSVSVQSCGNLKWVFPPSVGCGLPHTLECPNISLAKFTSNLEELETDRQGIRAIHGYAAEFCSKLRKVTLCSLDENTSVAVLHNFLGALKSLETLVFNGCSLNDLLDQRPIGDEQHHCLRVKHLELRFIRELNYITAKDSQFNQHLQTLHLERCRDLMGITPSSTCLQNLTALHVCYCGKMKNLVTASTAKTMVHLVEMKVLKCERIEEIVGKDGDDTEHDVMIIFNKLQRLELRGLPSLNSFCSDKYTLSFPLLGIVTIEQCPRMKSFGCGGAVCTPKLQGILFEGEQQWEGNLDATISSQLRAWVDDYLGDVSCFQNLQKVELVNSTISSKAALLPNQMHFLNKLREITLRDCNSTQLVFDLEGLSAAEGYIGLLPKLQQLNLVNLPLVTQLCSKSPIGILDFNKLQVLQIDNCSRLEYAFTWSMASFLPQLERVEMKNCEMMKTLIVDEEDVADKVTFNKLENVVLQNMPKFSSIYLGNNDLEFPSLKQVSIRECPSIKALLIGMQVHSNNQVFPKLEELSISVDMNSVRGMMQFEAPSLLFSNLKTLDLTHFPDTTTSHALLVRFLSRFPNLDRLEIRHSSFQELLNCNTEGTPTLPLIKSSMLTNLHKLCKIWWPASLIQSLETLEVSWCPSLVNLASSSASFQNLVTLTVLKCDQMMNLMTPSVAKSMVQLKLLRVKYCKMLMEIVGDGSDQATDEIVFPKLETLELIDLQSLKAFSLTHHHFSFPCLDRVLLMRCPNLRIFCNGIVNTEILNCVRDLNTTTEYLYHQMVGFVFREIKLSAFPVLIENWEAEFPTGFLYSLKRLEVDNCKLFSNAVPPRLLKHLKRLEVLVVEKCDCVEQVIDLEGLNANEFGNNGMGFLKELHLMDLPRLRQVWTKDPQHILIFKNLQTLKVDKCGSLTFIFDLSMALSLQNLQHIEVKHCNLVEHIIMIPEEETVLQYQTILPSLRSSTLLHLPNLFRFCSTSGVLEFPSLKTIEVADCPDVELFAATFPEGQHSSITVEERGDSISALLGNKIVMPGLEELKVEWTPLKDQLFGNYRSGFLSKLKRIELISFQGEEDAYFLSNFLRHFRSLENLCLTDSLIEEMTLDDLSDLKDDNNESVWMRLKISKFPMLKHLVRNDCQPIPLFENLVDLEVIECSSLKILVPCSVSFHNLTDLRVSKCDGLTTLLSASTARSLVQLRRMDVKNCKMMQEIVAIASDGEEYEIRFSQLEYLGFDDLPGLKNFSSGNYDFHFPSLEEVMIIECPNMKNFAEKVSVTTKLRKVKTGRLYWIEWEEEYEWEGKWDGEWEWEWEGSLNNTIQALYMQKDVEETAAIRSES